MNRTRLCRTRATPWPCGASWRLPRGKGCKVISKRAEGRAVVAGISRHLRSRISFHRVSHVCRKILRGGRSPRRKHQPRNTRLLSTLAPCVVAPEAILLCNDVPRLHGCVAGTRAARSNGAEHRLFVAKFEPNHSPRNLRLVHVRKNPGTR